MTIGDLAVLDNRVAMITALAKDGIHCHVTFLNDGRAPRKRWWVLRSKVKGAR